MAVPFKVVVKRCCDKTYWYSDRIGEEFEVVNEPVFPAAYRLATDPSKLIYKGDCTIVEKNQIINCDLECANAEETCPVHHPNKVVTDCKQFVPKEPVAPRFTTCTSAQGGTGGEGYTNAETFEYKGLFICKVDEGCYRIKYNPSDGHAIHHSDFADIQHAKNYIDKKDRQESFEDESPGSGGGSVVVSELIEPSYDLEETLKQRGETHGDFVIQFETAQCLKNICRAGAEYGDMPRPMKEVIDMVCHKLSRIVDGDPMFADHWHDIAGYCQLIDKGLKEGKL
jgi:hypothetical protein